MLIEQIIEFEWRGLGLLTVHVLLQLVIFMSKQKSLRKSWSELLFTAKILTKFNPKMQNYKRIFDQTIGLSKGRIEIIFFF